SPYGARNVILTLFQGFHPWLPSVAAPRLQEASRDFGSGQVIFAAAAVLPLVLARTQEPRSLLRTCAGGETDTPSRRRRRQPFLCFQRQLERAIDSLKSQFVNSACHFSLTRSVSE